MGLKCSVIGHKYGETVVERDREEQGSEVVITIEESETCERCGKTRIVSENKEVTSIETPSDIAGDMIADDAGDESEPAAAPEPSDSAAADDMTEPVFEEAEDTSGIGGDAVDPDADDAEILDDSDDDTPSGGDSELEEPSTVSMDEAEAGEPAEDPEADDGIIIDGESEDRSVDDDRKPGEWPAEPGQEEDDWEPATTTEDAESETEEAEPFGGNAVTVPNGKFRCPECDFTTDVESSSLRAGDFCPECHKGALVQTGE